MEEVWKDVEGYNGRYQISNLGRFKSFAQDTKNGKMKEGHKIRKGYLRVLLYDGKGRKNWHQIHRLVASAFIPNPEGLEQVNHKDEVKSNNCVDNLEWCTNYYNCRYGTKIARLSEANRCCPTTSKKVYSVDENENKEYFDSIGEASRRTGLEHGNIVRTLKGKSKTCGNRQWFYC